MATQVGKFFGASVGAVIVAVILVTVVAALPAHAEGRSKAPPTTAPHAATTSFNFNNIPVRSALQLLAEEGHFNLVVSDSVQGTISLHLVDVTWAEALDVVLRLKGLQQHVDGNTRSVTAAGE
jgi:type IV pilus assembly protein PilQ